MASTDCTMDKSDDVHEVVGIDFGSKSAVALHGVPGELWEVLRGSVSDVPDTRGIEVEGGCNTPEKGEVKAKDVITTVEAGAVNKPGPGAIVSSVVTSMTVEEPYPTATVWVSVTTETITV